MIEKVSEKLVKRRPELDLKAKRYRKLDTFEKIACDPGGIQTHDHLLRRQELYSAELPGRLAFNDR